MSIHPGQLEEIAQEVLGLILEIAALADYAPLPDGLVKQATAGAIELAAEVRGLSLDGDDRSRIYSTMEARANLAGAMLSAPEHVQCRLN